MHRRCCFALLLYTIWAGTFGSAGLVQLMGFFDCLSRLSSKLASLAISSASFLSATSWCPHPMCRNKYPGCSTFTVQSAIKIIAPSRTSATAISNFAQ